VSQISFIALSVEILLSTNPAFKLFIMLIVQHFEKGHWKDREKMIVRYLIGITIPLKYRCKQIYYEGFSTNITNLLNPDAPV